MKNFLADLPHFDILQDSDLDWMTTVAQQKTFPTGTQLIQQGRSCESIYLSLNGNLGIMESQPGGGKQHLITLSSAAVIGETSLLDNRLPSTTIEAVALSEVLVLPKQHLAQKLQCDRDFAARFYHILAIQLSERLRELSQLMATKQIKEGEPLRKVLMVFATLNDSDAAWMLANGVAEKFPLETVLIEQGKSVPAVYLLLEGILGIYISIGNNGVQEKEVGKRVKGDILGEMSLIDGGLASATVKTLENAWVLALPQTKLTSKLQEDPGFASRFYRAIAQILSNRYQDLLVLGGSEFNSDQEMLSEDIEIEDEIDLDVLDGTTIAATRFDWMIQQLRS